MRVARIGILVAEIDRKFAADDRLDAVSRHLVGEFQRPEHVVGVGQRQRRLPVGLGEFAKLGDLDRALQQRIGGMDVEMDESGARHARVWLPGFVAIDGLRGDGAVPASDLAKPIVRPRAAQVYASAAVAGRCPDFPQRRAILNSKLWKDLCPDCDHSHKQRDRRQRSRLFDKHPQHHCLLERRTYHEHVLFLFSRQGQASHFIRRYHSKPTAWLKNSLMSSAIKAGTVRSMRVPRGADYD